MISQLNTKIINHKLEGSTLNKNNTFFITLAMLVSLTACSDVEPLTDAQNVEPVAAVSATNDDQMKSIQLDLKSTSIDKMEFLGLKVPVIKEAAPCPYLSDQAALAAVKTNWTLKRRQTSIDECYWSKNLGFSIKLTVEPLGTAKPVREQVYNLEHPPVLKEQSAPGQNAVVLYDTAWGKERAYAVSFEQEKKLVMLYVTGLNTDANRLMAAALEVSSKLSSAAVLEQQSESVEFNMCSTWNKSEIETIIGSPIRLNGSKDNCSWELGTGENLRQINIGIFYGKTYPWDSVISDGAIELNGIGERSVIIQQRKKGNKPGSVLLNTLYNERLVAVSVSDTIDNHKEIAIALSKNINKRFK